MGRQIVTGAFAARGRVWRSWWLPLVFSLGLALLVPASASAGRFGRQLTPALNGRVAARISIVGVQLITPSVSKGVWAWTGTPSRLGAAGVVARADWPVLSPNGRLLAYVLDGELRVQPLGGGAARTVTHVPAEAGQMAFSPSGAQIAFIADGAIVQQPVVGKGPVRRVLLPSSWRESSFGGLQWSSTGFAFSRMPGGANGVHRDELDFVRPDGSARVLYRKATGVSGWPSFSPDGMHIVVSTSHGGLLSPPTGDGLLSIPTGAGVRNKLTTRHEDGTAVWSPDGARVAFTRWMSVDNGVADVWVVRADGTGLRRLTTTPIPAQFTARGRSAPLAWSPDGKQLLIFHRDRFAVLDVTTRATRDLRRVGTQFVNPAGRWS
jgi:WD40-like Beta Propeller Repeat